MIKAESFFPETLPFNIEVGRARCDSLGMKITPEKQIQTWRGKTLEVALASNARLVTKAEVYETTEAVDEQWFDFNIGGDIITIDPKSRMLCASSYTLSAPEKRKQFPYSKNKLFVWPLYITDGALFVLEAVLARCAIHGLVIPPVYPSKFEKQYAEPGWYWNAKDVQLRGTIALRQIDDLGLLDLLEPK